MDEVSDELKRLIRMMQSLPVSHKRHDSCAVLCFDDGLIIKTNRDRYPGLPEMALHMWGKDSDLFYSVGGSNWSLYFREGGTENDIEVLRLTNLDGFKTAMCLIGLVK